MGGNHLKANSLGDPKGSPWPSNVESIDAARTLDDDDNGKCFLLNAAAGAPITLPAPKSGLNFRFVVALAFATTPWTIVTNGGDNVIQGNSVVNGASVIASDEDQIELDEGSDTVGDHIELFSDGTSWFVSGVGAAAGSIVFTAT